VPEIKDAEEPSGTHCWNPSEAIGTESNTSKEPQSKEPKEAQSKESRTVTSEVDG
jgi:hypothetical protein